MKPALSTLAEYNAENPGETTIPLPACACSASTALDGSATVTVTAVDGSVVELPNAKLMRFPLVTDGTTAPGGSTVKPGPASEAEGDDRLKGTTIVVNVRLHSPRVLSWKPEVAMVHVAPATVVASPQGSSATRNTASIVLCRLDGTAMNRLRL